MSRHLIAALLALSLVACADDPPPPPPPAPAAPEPAPEPAPPPAPALEEITEARINLLLAGDHRAPDHADRDVFRHPRETLLFFGLRPDSSVIEIAPGSGWYAELLAPLVREDGRYVGAINDPEKAASDRAREYFANANAALRTKFEARPDVYDRAELVEIDPAAPVFGAPESVDVVLTFRNVHGWLNGGSAEATFQAAFEVLRPGGILGVVQHRAASGAEYSGNGYVSEEQVIALAEGAGFVYAQSSDINANPADTRDHPNGVWNLPPTLRVNEGDDVEKYRAIGESDRMTIRFLKPERSEEVVDD